MPRVGQGILLPDPHVRYANHPGVVLRRTAGQRRLLQTKFLAAALYSRCATAQRCVREYERCGREIGAIGGQIHRPGFSHDMQPRFAQAQAARRDDARGALVDVEMLGAE